MSSKKKNTKKKKTKKNDSEKLATDNEENITEIEIIEDSLEDDDKYDELLDDSLSEMSSDDEIDKDCIYYEKDNFFDNKKVIDEDNIYITGDERITRPILTKFEYVRILTDRIKQLALGAKPLLSNINGLNDKEIAILEIKNKKCPFKIERPLPNGQKEIFKLEELAIKDNYK